MVNVSIPRLEVYPVLVRPRHDLCGRKDRPAGKIALPQPVLWEEGLVSVDPLVVDVDAVAGSDEVHVEGVALERGPRAA